MFDPVLSAAVILAIVGIGVLALWRGDWPEKAIAGGTLVALAATPLIQLHPLGRDPHYGAFIVDALLLVVVIGVAMKANRWWPLFFCAFTVMDALTHLTLAADESLIPVAQGPGAFVWTGLCLTALATGVWDAERRRRSQGAA